VLGGRGAGTGGDKVGLEAGADGGVSEVPFDLKAFCSQLLLFFLKLKSCSCHLFPARDMRSESMDVSDNSGIIELKEGCVNIVKGGGVRREDAEVCVAKPRSIDVWRRASSGMKGNGVLWVALLADSHKVCLTSHVPVANVLG
jgi:hypothetical protein